MKGQLIISFLMFTMIFLILSFTSTENSQAQRQKKQQIHNDWNENSYPDDNEDIPLMDVYAPPQFQQSTGPGNLIYVEDNLSQGSGIMIFRRGNDGSLTKLKTISTGGKGMFDVTGFNRAPTGVFAAVDIGPFEHDGIMIMNDERTRLFVCNQGSDDLSVFDVSADGLDLTPVPGSPFKTGRIPSSVAIAAFDTVVVVNKNDPAGNPKPPGLQGSVMTYKMASNGSLTPVPNSEIKFPGATCGEGVICNQSSTPSQVIPSIDKKVVFVNDFFAGMIRPFKVNPDGTLTATKPFNIRSLGPSVLPINLGNFPFSLGLGIHPSKNILYTGLLFENKIGVFRYNPNSGKLKFVRAMPNGGSTVCWFYIRKDGRHMWTSNQASNDASTYDLTDPEAPVETQLIKFEGCGEPSHVIGSPADTWIHFTNSAVTNKCSQKDPNTRSNMIHTLRINSQTGFLTELIQPQVMMELPLGERIQGVASK